MNSRGFKFHYSYSIPFNLTNVWDFLWINSEGLILSSEKEKENCYLEFTSAAIEVTVGSFRSSCNNGRNKRDARAKIVVLPNRPIYWAAVRPSHKMGVRSSAAKNGLPGEGRHEGLVPRNDVLTNGFI